MCQFHLGFPIILRIIGTLLAQLAGGGGGEGTKNGDVKNGAGARAGGGGGGAGEEEQTTWTFKIGVVSRSSTKLPIM